MYLKVIAINSDIYIKSVTTEVSEEEKDSKDDPARRYAIGGEEKQVKQPQKVGVPQRRNHGEVIWSSGDTGASVPERKTKNCLFEDTKARRGVYQVGGEGGGVTGYVWEVSPAHRPMPMTLATLSTLAGPSSMVPGAPTMPRQYFLDWDPPAPRAPQAFGSPPNLACRAHPNYPPRDTAHPHGHLQDYNHTRTPVCSLLWWDCILEEMPNVCTHMCFEGLRCWV